MKKIISKPFNYLKNYIFLSSCSNYNSIEVRRKSRTKNLGKEMFKKHNIPTAKGLIFINPYKAYKYVKKNGFPIVLKPNAGGFSRGSFFPITNYNSFFKALFLVKFFWPKTVIEKYVDGKNYRIVVGNNKILAITRRYPAYIIGDGINTIKKLINIENVIREKLKLFPVCSKIIINKELKSYLNNNYKNITLNSIPKKCEYIRLKNKITLNSGGIIENIDIKKIPKKNQDLFLKVLKVFDASIFGIDVIFEKDILIDFDKQECIFLEVNSRPYIKMHEFPRFGDKINIENLMKK